MSQSAQESAKSEYIAESEEILQRTGEVLKLLGSEPPTRERLDLIYREIHTMKGSSQLFGFLQIAEVAHAMETSLEPLRKQVASPSPALTEALFRGLDAMELMVVALRTGETLDVSIMVANILSQLSGGTLPTPAAIIDEHPHDHPAKAEVVNAHAADAASESASIRVSVSLLDKLMTLMGEMVLVRNQVLQFSNRSDDLEFLNLSQRLDVVTSEIQGEVMKTRMQPVGNVVTKFQRVVRELSRELGKKIELTFSGMETELDRTLLEAIKDPIMHIVRNSCDHGLETIADRKTAGKPEAGTIAIKAFHEGGQVVIEVSDDGRGLNREKLVKKAVENKLITADAGAALSERDAFALIFEAGFSTASSVTNVSGRGVGMDVVRNNIEGIGGTVELRSETGKGTSLRLKIPLTLAIVPAMVVRLRNDRFVIPQVKLVELVRVEDGGVNKIEYLQGRAIYRLRGNLLPLVVLSEALGLGPAPKSDITNIAVLNAEGTLFGLILDEVQDTAEVVVKPLAGFLKSMTMYSGATVLGDGSVALILDVQGLAVSQNLVSSGQRVTNVSAGEKFNADTQQFLLLRVDSNTKHAVPLNLVHRLEEFPRSAVEMSGNMRVLRYRGSVLPLISCNQLLGLHPSAPPSDKISVIVSQKSGRYYGLEVNEILDVLNTNEDMLESVSPTPLILGNLIEQDEIIVIIDILYMMDMASGNVEEPRKKLAAKSEQIHRILFAEDTVFFRKHVIAILEKSGYEITAAENGKAALTLLQNSSTPAFDLILSDIEMPVMNGLEFAQAVRANRAWDKIPMIALTTKFNPAHQQEGLKAGFDLYLEKLKSDILLHEIASLLSGTWQRKAV